MSGRPGGPVRVLMIDDDEEDYDLTRDALRTSGGDDYVLDRVATYEEGRRALLAGQHDVYLVDYKLGPASGLDLLRDVMPVGHRPIILLTGMGDRDVDVAAMEAGAMDYLIKGRVDGELLERAIRYALERSRLIRELREALAQIRTLRELLPMCTWCKRVRNDEGAWEDVASYLHRRSEADVTHGVCPDCLQKHYPEYAE